MAKSLSQPWPVETVITIQYLRAVAAALIVFLHAVGIPVFKQYTAHFGTVGVDLFFVISGFIMWTTTRDQNRGPGAFWLARITRIVPLYWLFTAAYVLAALIIPAGFFNLKLDAVHIIKSFLFIPAEHPTLGWPAPVFTLGWTLNYEMFFYLWFGLCLLLPNRRLRFLLLATILGGLVGVGVWLQPHGPILATYLDPLLLEFLAGVVLAILSPYLARCGAVLGATLVAAAALWIGLVYSHELALPRVIMNGVPSMMAVAGALMLESLARTHPSRLGVLLGDASYSIYLVHPFAQRALWIAVVQTIGLTAVPQTLYIFAAFATGILAGVVCYLILERPLLKAGRRLVRLAQRSTDPTYSQLITLRSPPNPTKGLPL